ncbi:MAG: hypothetical protein M1546_16745 [Chloroflexi bacterium]|nr:hypothetical protein [Chloroflexota bacterium]
MTSTPSIDLRPRSVAELLDLTFHLYRQHFVPLIAVTLIVMGPLLALSLLSSAGSLAQYMAVFNASVSDDAGGIGAATVLGNMVSLCAGGLTLLLGIFVPWMDGAVTYNVIERILGHKPTWRESYRVTQPHWGALWVANAIRTIVLVLALIPLLVGLYGSLFAGVLGLGALSAESSSGLDGGLMVLGLLAICLPIGLVGTGAAVYTAIVWCLANPAVVGEGIGGSAALERSNALVRDMRWRMAGRLFIFEIMRFVIITLPMLVMQAFIFGGSIAAANGGDQSVLAIIGFIGSSIFSLVANVLVVPLYATYITVNYFDLRIRKEHLDLQLKAEQIAPTVTAMPPELAMASQQGTAAGMAPAITSTRPGLVPPDVPDALPPTVTMPPLADSHLPVIDLSLTPGQRISQLFTQIRAQGENADLLNELGLAYQEIGDLYGALDALTRARALDPEDPDIAYNMALLQRDRKDWAAARRAMADYLRLETDEAERQKVRDTPAFNDILP